MVSQGDVDTNEISMNDAHHSHGPPSSRNLLKKLLNEFIGTYYLMIIGILSMVHFPNDFGGAIARSVAWGVTLTLMIYCTYPPVDAHFNPAVTISRAIFGRFPWKEVPWYILCQVLASFLSSGVMVIGFGLDSEQFRQIIPTRTPTKCLVVEILLSSVVSFISSLYVINTAGQAQAASLSLPAQVGGINIFAGTYSGICINPIKVLGPALVFLEFEDLWIFILGPIVGFSLGNLIAKFFKRFEESINYVPLY